MAQLAYTENRPRCRLCHLPSFGAFVATFKRKEGESEELVFLCAECGFHYAFQAWSGNWGKHLKSLRLEVIFKLPGDKAPKPKKDLPLEDRFVASQYEATFMIEGDVFKGPIEDLSNVGGTFATEWAALERARQIGHSLARGLNKRNHWQVQTGITRLNGVKP